MLNMFKVKRIVALTVPPVLTVLMFYLALITWGLLWSLAFMLTGVVISLIIGTLLLKNPFTAMVEGKGILALNIDSTGVIRPFIVGVKAPYIRGKIGGKKIEDAFNRDTVTHIARPQKANKLLEETEKGGIKIEITNEEYNKGRFALFHYPVILYNEQIGTIITKDFLSEKEKETFAEHGVLYLNRKVQELTSVVRDFGRHVVETLRPKDSLLTNKWVWIVIAILVIILIVMFAPAILDVMSNLGNNAIGAVGGGSAPVTPR